jgi:hypothetical protein
MSLSKYDCLLLPPQFTFLASELLKAGEAELAEDVLDYRDYL